MFKWLFFVAVICCPLLYKAQEYFAPLYSIALPNANEKIYDVLEDQANNRLYVAGDFTSIGGVARNYVACFNLTTGAAIPGFNANISATSSYKVNTLCLYNNVLYIGGYFNSVGGQTRQGCAAVDASTGALKTGFTANAPGAVEIKTMLQYNGNLYLGGNFSTINGITRNGFAVVSTSTGTVSSITASISSSPILGVTKMVLNNNNIYFTTDNNSTINGSTRNYLAKVNAATCGLDSWNPNPNGQVNDISIYENELNICGAFTNIFSAEYYHFVRVELQAEIPVNTTSSDIFTRTSLLPWSCANSISNYLSPVNSPFIYPTGTANYPQQYARFKDMQFFYTFFGGYNTDITIWSDPKSNNQIIDFDYHPSSCLSVSGYRFPFMHYGYSNYSNIAQSVDFIRASGERLYTSTKAAHVLSFPGAKRLEVLGCMPKIPTAFDAASPAVVCAATDVVYKIPKFAYTKQYSWSYSGTGVTIDANDTIATVHFAKNSTSGILSVKCKGVYDRTILNNTVLDLPIDSVFMAITVNPVPYVNAGPDLTANCSNNKVVTLNGASGPGTTVDWIGPINSDAISKHLSHLLINQPAGNYILQSEMTSTGCKWSDTTYVTLDTAKPNLTMPVLTTNVLNCARPVAQLNASSTTAGTTLLWSNTQGFSSANPVTITTNTPFVSTKTTDYKVVATNTYNGCKDSGSVSLTVDTLPPTYGLSVNPVSSVINCINTTAELTGITGVARAKLFWSGGSIVTNSFNPVTVSAPANYTLTALDTINGCTAKLIYAVIADTAKPVVNPLPSVRYRTCDTSLVELNASSPNTSTLFSWKTPDGSSVSNTEFVKIPGTYELTASNSNNGCKLTRTLAVVADTVAPSVTTNADSVVLSCHVLSYSLSASTSAAPASIHWSGNGGYTSLNPAVVTNEGPYSVEIKNTFNGCKTNKIVNVLSNKTEPFINPFTVAPELNCSYSSISIGASTFPPNTFSLSWNGPSGYSSSDPAVITTQGTYTVTAYDPENGCSAEKTLNVDYRPKLVVDAGADRHICFGGDVTLFANPVGGTPGFDHSWSTGALLDSISVAPTDTTTYIITINDQAGCSGSDSVKVIVAAQLQDSIRTYLPCDPNNPVGQIQVYPFGGVPPYIFSLDSSAFNASNVFTDLSYGNYTIQIKDSLGCNKVSNAAIDNSSLQPAADFLITTNMFSTDTFVVVDISNPRPDSVQWEFPSSTSIVNNSNPFSPVIVNSDTGTFTVKMRSFFGTCEMNSEKTIHIGNFDPALAKENNNNGIESIVLYPNPNGGQFNVAVTLYKKQTFAVLVYDAAGLEKFRQTIAEGDAYDQLINVNQPYPGSYVLKVVAEYDSKQKTFIITQ